MMNIGDLYLEYSDDDEEVCYEAKITEYVKRGKEVSFVFCGNCTDSGRFFGNCRASLRGDKYYGSGEFQEKGGEVVKAEVNFAILEDGLRLSGEWKDEDETFSYTLDVYL